MIFKEVIRLGRASQQQPKNKNRQVSKELAVFVCPQSARQLLDKRHKNGR
jgi:hypothetical protein